MGRHGNSPKKSGTRTARHGQDRASGRPGTMVGPGLGRTLGTVARHGHGPKNGPARRWPGLPEQTLYINLQTLILSFLFLPSLQLNSRRPPFSLPLGLSSRWPDLPANTAASLSLPTSPANAAGSLLPYWEPRRQLEPHLSQGPRRPQLPRGRRGTVAPGLQHQGTTRLGSGLPRGRRRVRLLAARSSRRPSSLPDFLDRFCAGFEFDTGVYSYVM
jgi:hypothetical protein